MTRFTPQVPDCMKDRGPHEVGSAAYTIGRYRASLPASEAEAKAVWLAVCEHLARRTPRITLQRRQASYITAVNSLDDQLAATSPAARAEAVAFVTDHFGGPQPKKSPRRSSLEVLSEGVVSGPASGIGGVAKHWTTCG